MLSGFVRIMGRAAKIKIERTPSKGMVHQNKNATRPGWARMSSI